MNFGEVLAYASELIGINVRLLEIKIYDEVDDRMDRIITALEHDIEAIGINFEIWTLRSDQNSSRFFGDYHFFACEDPSLQIEYEKTTLQKRIKQEKGQAVYVAYFSKKTYPHIQPIMHSYGVLGLSSNGIYDIVVDNNFFTTVTGVYVDEDSPRYFSCIISSSDSAGYSWTDGPPPAKWVRYISDEGDLYKSPLNADWHSIAPYKDLSANEYWGVNFYIIPGISAMIKQNGAWLRVHPQWIILNMDSPALPKDVSKEVRAWSAIAND